MMTSVNVKGCLIRFLAHTFLFLVFSCSLVAEQRYETFTLQSTSMGESREVLVSLPANYHSEAFFRFPALYITDAGSQLDHISSMVHYLSGTISPMIVVGVVSNNRVAELSPFKPNGSMSEKSAQFRQFIVNEVKPLIEKTYRAAEFSILSGHSLGGVFALNAYRSSPSDFEAFISLAPSFAWGNEKLLDVLSSRFSKVQQPHVAVFFEGLSPFPTPKRSFDTITELVEKHVHLSQTHSVGLLEQEDHMSVAHLGTYLALKKMYTGWFLSIPKVLSSENALDEHFQTLSSRLGYSVMPTENELWELTSALVRQNNLRAAERIAQQASVFYPESHFSFSLMADVEIAKKNNDGAVIYLNKAIALSEHVPERQARYKSKLKEL